MRLITDILTLLQVETDPIINTFLRDSFITI